MAAFNNATRTAVLFAAFGSGAVTAGALLGGLHGAELGLALALLAVGVSSATSDRLALRSTHARRLDERDAPELFAMVRDLAGHAGLPVPGMALSPSPRPNAFVAGWSPHRAVVCVTSGLLTTLPGEQLQAVVAHELMHVKHRDIVIGALAAAGATVTSFVVDVTVGGAMSGGSGGSKPLAPLAVVIAPIAASLLQLGLSRRRELGADRGAAELLGGGEPLAEALETIESQTAGRSHAVAAQPVYAWIRSPVAEQRRGRRDKRLDVLSTHPHSRARIQRLRPPAGR